MGISLRHSQKLGKWNLSKCNVQNLNFFAWVTFLMSQRVLWSPQSWRATLGIRVSPRWPLLQLWYRYRYQESKYQQAWMPIYLLFLGSGQLNLWTPMPLPLVGSPKQIKFLCLASLKDFEAIACHGSMPESLFFPTQTAKVTPICCFITWW